MDVDLKVVCEEEYLPSPRHRKLQRRPLEGRMTITIPEATEAESPVAMTLRRPERPPVPLCWYGGRLWAPLDWDPWDRNPSAPDAASKEKTVADLQHTAAFWGRHRLWYEVKKYIDETLDHRLIVGDVVLRDTSEPRYAVTHYYGYHGGTTLSIVYDGEPTYKAPTIFSALDLDAALAATQEDASRHGSEFVDDRDGRIEVLVPEAVQIPTRAYLAEWEKQRVRFVTREVCFEISRDDGLAMDDAAADEAVAEFIRQFAEPFHNRNMMVGHRIGYKIESVELVDVQPSEAS